MKKDSHWSGKTRGGRFGNWWFLMLVRCFGLWSAYLWLVPVAAYFTIFAHRERRSSVNYLKRLLGAQSFWKWPWLVFRHFYSAGITLLDRVAVIMGKEQMRFNLEGEPEVLKVIHEKKGFILLTAHVGGWEMGGHVMGRHDQIVNFVMLEREEQRIRQLFNEALHHKKFNILTASDDPLRSIPIVAALRRGEIVAMHGDRTFGNDATIRIPFLGSFAEFPAGPYLLAAATGAPIIQVFVLREKLGHYRFMSFPALHVPRERGAKREEILSQCVAQYTQRLTSVLKQYPFQWYNFYPFWNEALDEKNLS